MTEINDYFIYINKSNNIKEISKNKIVDSKLKYVDNYVLNIIVNHANYSYTKKIKDADIVKEIALNIYKKNKKHNRHNILKNYLSGTNDKFKSKQQMQQAIKNINNELEESKIKFSELFKDDSYSENFMI